MKTIAFDCDDVLNDLKTVWVSAYNVKYEDKLTVEDIVTWDFHTIVKPECGQCIYDILKYPKFYYNLPVKGNAVEVIKRLSDNYNIIIVTDVSYAIENVRDKIEWLQKHFPFIPIQNYYLCHDKSRINADYLVDDNPNNLKGFSGTGVLMDMPYNRNEKDYVRVKNFNEILKYFRAQ